MIGLLGEQRVDLPCIQEPGDFSLMALLFTNVAGTDAVVVPGVHDWSGVPNRSNFCYFGNIVVNDRDLCSTLVHEIVVVSAGLSDKSSQPLTLRPRRVRAIRGGMPACNLFVEVTFHVALENQASLWPGPSSDDAP